LQIFTSTDRNIQMTNSSETDMEYFNIDIEGGVARTTACFLSKMGGDGTFSNVNTVYNKNETQLWKGTVNSGSSNPEPVTF